MFNRPILNWSPERSQYYYLYNGHGDVVQIIDSDGNTVNRYSYDEWGNILSQTEQIKNPFKYAGEIYDAETGLYYLRARYYDPSVGRFISKDSYEGKITNPLSLNLYMYVYGNPLIYVDPSGHLAEGDYLSYNPNYRSDDVKELQARLNELGYNAGRVDGFFGDRTLAAVNAYKNYMGLGNEGWAYGKVGRQTWESLGFSVVQRPRYNPTNNGSQGNQSSNDLGSPNAFVTSTGGSASLLVGVAGSVDTLGMTDSNGRNSLSFFITGTVSLGPSIGASLSSSGGPGFNYLNPGDYEGPSDGFNVSGAVLTGSINYCGLNSKGQPKYTMPVGVQTPSELGASRTWSWTKRLYTWEE